MRIIQRVLALGQAASQIQGARPGTGKGSLRRMGDSGESKGMGRFWGKVKSFCKSKIRLTLFLIGLLVLFLLLGVALSAMEGFGLYGFWFYIQAPLLAWMAALFVFVMGMTGIGKDFLNGFRLVFSNKKNNVSRIELQKAAKAMEFAGKLVVTEAVLTCAMRVIPLLYLMEPFALWHLGPLLSVFLLSVSYVALAFLVVIPLRIRLEGMAISYMDVEQPEEEGESGMQDAQTIYFKLRGLGLTDREAEVARLVCSGMTNREIGELLYISDATVKKHMSHILEKTQCGDREILTEKVKGL